MDVQMPVMDGLTATRAIREWESYHEVEPTPIIAVTALAGIRTRCIGAGCDAFVTKPLDRRELVARIDELTSRSPQAV